jgi:transposase
VTRWDSLTLYVADGRLDIDNNPAERSLRGIALSRKTFLLLRSEAGGDRAAILYTVLETAKLNSLDPEACLADVIDPIAKGHPINRLARRAHEEIRSLPRPSLETKSGSRGP